MRPVSDDYGPRPWVQRHWDWRATGNFVLGGAGSGLLLAAALVLPLGPARAVALVLGLALVALGLFSVLMKIGKPMRALHVFLNPRTSWMAREAWVALPLFAITAYAFLRPSTQAEILLGATALAYAWCQARILHASKGIPAWREPKLIPFMVATALAEGAALAVLAALAYDQQGKLVYGLFAAALLARAAAWFAYTARIVSVLTGGARDALQTVTPILLWFGTFGALALVAAASALPRAYAAFLAIAAALVAIGTGWHAKSTLVTRASLNQGFALPRIPVRGAR
jgi:phenylacetyl-CoA:acceptor oxidoreductase subunit 2